MNATQLRDVAHELADAADAISLPAFRDHVSVRTKSDGTWVTDADTGIEQRLRELILARHPDHAVFGEESGHSGPADVPTWVIDPIDGTTNFVKGNPIFATLIAVRVDNQELASVVSAPALATRWDAASGAGARCDGRSIQVSTIDALADAEVAFGGLGWFEQLGWGDAVRRLVGATRRQRGYGDFWQHCLVAQGSTDVALEATVNLWDLAAVKLVVEEAGGRFTSFDGVATADGGNAVSSNGLLHDEVLEVLHA